VAVSTCARRGVLLRGGDVLDAVTNCRTIALDKTGTLTTGRLTSTSVEPLCCVQHTCDVERPCDEIALSVAAALERGATHPIASSVAAAAAAAECLPPVEVRVRGSSLPLSIDLESLKVKESVLTLSGQKQLLWSCTRQALNSPTTEHSVPSLSAAM